MITKMSKRVLIVDDAAFMRMQLKEAFIRCGAEVVGEAAGGAECIEQYRALRPDLVTLDITMPDMDGITALKQLKALYPEAKVVMCSSMGHHEKLIACIQAGAMDFIVKPFKMEKLESIIRNI